MSLILDGLILTPGGGGGGTSNYNDLTHKPAIDGVTLTSNTTKEDLSLDRIVRILGSVDTVSDLVDIEDPNIGDSYKVLEESAYYVFNGTEWEVLGGGTGAGITRNVVLSAQNWVQGEQIVNVSGVTADNTVIVGASPNSTEDYEESGIMCVAQSSNQLTFTSLFTPTEDINVNIIIM